MERDEHYWMGSLAMTVAQATVHPNPQAYCKGALREFLKDRPAGCELAHLLRLTLKEKP